MSVIHVRFADAPTDVLVWLVDHGPTTREDLVRLVPPPDATQPSVIVSSALRLLFDCGLVDVEPCTVGSNPWRATDAGRQAVSDARTEASPSSSGRPLVGPSDGEGR